MSNSQVLFKRELIVFNYIRNNYHISKSKKIPIPIPIPIQYIILEFSKRCLTGSHLVTIKQDMLLIKAIQTLLSFNIIYCNFLFRASENNYSAQKFHQICDNENLLQTIVIIKSNHGNIFGGLTGQAGGWKNINDDDDETILFLIKSDDERLQQKCPLILTKKVKQDQSIYCNPKCGPIFGDGFDIYIGDSCNEKRKDENGSYISRNYTTIQSYYNEEFEIDIDCLCGGDEINLTITNGIAWMFDVSEYEVFEIIS